MQTHQVTFKVSLLAELESNGFETRVSATLVMGVGSLTGKICSIVWPTITELNSIRSNEDRLGCVSQYSIAQIQKIYDHHRLGNYRLPGKQ